MKVLMLCNGALTPDKGGGIASVISSIVKHTCSKVDFTIASLGDNYESTEIRDIYPSSVAIIIGRENLRDNLSLLLSKNNDFDVIHVHGLDRYALVPPLVNIFKGMRAPVIYSHHIGLEFTLADPFKLSYHYAYFNIVSRGWRKVIVNSQYCAKNEFNKFKHLKHKIVLLPNGADIDLIHNLPSERIDGNPAILFLGHPTYLKGFDILLKAFELLSKDPQARWAQLHIVGSSDEDQNYKEYVRLRGLSQKVHFWGYIPHSHAMSLLKGADILVLPSRYENFPVVLLEAMAAGKPIIATDAGGIPEIIKDKTNGLLVKPSVSEIAGALKELIENQELRKFLSQNNTRDAEKFSWKKVSEKYVDLYESLRR